MVNRIFNPSIVPIFLLCINLLLGPFCFFNFSMQGHFAIFDCDISIFTILLLAIFSFTSLDYVGVL